MTEPAEEKEAVVKRASRGGNEPVCGSAGDSPMFVRPWRRRTHDRRLIALAETLKRVVPVFRWSSDSTLFLGS